MTNDSTLRIKHRYLLWSFVVIYYFRLFFACAFNRLAQSPYASSDKRTYLYAELAISFLFCLTVAVTIANIHFADPRRDGQNELVWAASSNKKTVYTRTVTHLSTNPAGRRATLLC